MRLKGKSAIVTGAGAGYGAGIARRFAVEGARVICVDIDEGAARAIATEIGGVAVRCDISSGESVKAMVETAGSFDILVNNPALTQKPSRVAKIAEAELDRLLSVNIKSLYHMAVHALPVIRAAGGGSVINIASVGALRPRPGMTWYNATKSAMITITQSMAAELAPDNIRVNAIAPVVGRTAMLEHMFGDAVEEGVQRLMSTIPLGRLAEPADIAAAAVFLASDEASFITGVTLPVDGGRTVS